MSARARGLPVLFVAAALVSCDALNGLTGSRWEVVDANGDKGELHVVMTASDFRIGMPEHVRVERTETRRKDDGTEPEKRERRVRVVSGRCEEQFVCEVTPNPSIPGEIVITPKRFGDTTLHVTVMLDDKDEVTDKMHVRVLP
jgi:hypothetical protein